MRRTCTTLCLVVSLFGEAFGQTTPVEPGVTNGVITSTYADNQGKMYFTLNAKSAKPPKCATQSGKFAFDTNTPGGRSIAAIAMGAAALHRTVSVKGTGQCSIITDAEDVLAIKVDE